MQGHDQTTNVRRAKLRPLDISVVDGGTIRAHGRTIRLVGFNTPENGDRSKCMHVRELAISAQLQTLVAGGGQDLQLVPCACPTRHRRNCCRQFWPRLRLPLFTRPGVGAALISERLAQPYHCAATSCPASHHGAVEWRETKSQQVLANAQRRPNAADHCEL